MLAGLAASALPAIARNVLPSLGVGALSGLASTGVSKAVGRGIKGGCNETIGSGLFLKKGGEVAQIEMDGEGLFLKPYRGKGLEQYGDGLFLKRGKNLYDGSG